MTQDAYSRRTEAAYAILRQGADPEAENARSGGMYGRQKKYRERLKSEGRCRTCGAPRKLQCGMCQAVYYGFEAHVEHMKFRHGVAMTVEDMRQLWDSTRG